MACIQKHWCEHKASVTISVKEDEWFEVGAWVYKHFDWILSVSFLILRACVKQPYQDCDSVVYQRELDKMLRI